MYVTGHLNEKSKILHVPEVTCNRVFLGSVTKVTYNTVGVLPEWSHVSLSGDNYLYTQLRLTIGGPFPLSVHLHRSATVPRLMF